VRCAGAASTRGASTSTAKRSRWPSCGPRSTPRSERSSRQRRRERRLEAATRRPSPRVLLRVTPDVLGDTTRDIHRPADSKFGVAMGDEPALVANDCGPPGSRHRTASNSTSAPTAHVVPYARAAAAVAQLGLRRRQRGSGLGAAKPTSARDRRGYVATRSTRCALISATAADSRERFARSGQLDSHALHRASVKRYVSSGSRGRRHVRKPATVALRRPIRGARPDPFGRRHALPHRGKHCESADVIAREVRLGGGGPTQAGDVLVTPAPARTVSRWQKLLRSVPRPGGVSQATVNARLVCAGDQRGAACPRRLTRPLGHGTVARFAELIRRPRRPGRTFTGLRPPWPAC